MPDSMCYSNIISSTAGIVKIFSPAKMPSASNEKSAGITPSAFSCSINAKLHVSIHRGKPLNGRMPDSKCYDYIIPTGCCAVKPFPASPPTDPGPSHPPLRTHIGSGQPVLQDQSFHPGMRTLHTALNFSLAILSVRFLLYSITSYNRASRHLE